MEQNCECCTYWERWCYKLYFGCCHRYPKRHNSNGKWPVTYAKDWCGEFKKREKPPLEKQDAKS